LLYEKFKNKKDQKDKENQPKSLFEEVEAFLDKEKELENDRLEKSSGKKKRGHVLKKSEQLNCWRSFIDVEDRLKMQA